MVCIVSDWLCFEFMLLTAIFPLVVCLFHLLLLGSLYGNFIIISCMSCGVLHSLVFIQILAENNSLVSCKLSIMYCLFCQNIYWPHTLYVYFQLIINFYICGGSYIIVTCHISSLIMYKMGHHSFTVVKDTFFSLVYCSLFKIMWTERQMFAIILKY
jgi:hypothetical protein